MVWDPTHVQLLVIRAKGLLTKGKNGTNDAFVVMSLGKEKFQTSIKDRSGPNVDWQEECELAIPSQGNTAEINVTVYHRSMLGIDEFLGTVSLPLKNFDVYEHPKPKWYPLEFKNDKKQGYRGEVELMVSFTVKSGSLTDLSKKDKHKGSLGQLSIKAQNFGGSLMNLGTNSKGGIKKLASSVGHKIGKIPGRSSLRGDKRAESGYFERRGSGRSMQSSSIGDPDQGAISEDEEDEFKIDEFSQRSSSSSLNTAGQGFTPVQGSLENLAGGEFLSRSFSGPRSGTLPANLSLAGKSTALETVPNKPPRLGTMASPDEWEKKLFGRNAKATERPVDDTPVESSVPSIVVQQQPVTSPTEEPDPDAYQFTRRNASRRGRKKPEEQMEKEVRSAVVAPMPRNPEPEKVEPKSPVKGMNQFEPRHEHVDSNPFDVEVSLGDVDDTRETSMDSDWMHQRPLDNVSLGVPQEIGTIKEEDEAMVDGDLRNEQSLIDDVRSYERELEISSFDRDEVSRVTNLENQDSMEHDEPVKILIKQEDSPLGLPEGVQDSTFLVSDDLDFVDLPVVGDNTRGVVKAETLEQTFMSVEGTLQTKLASDRHPHAPVSVSPTVDTAVKVEAPDQRFGGSEETVQTDLLLDKGPKVSETGKRAEIPVPLARKVLPFNVKSVVKKEPESYHVVTSGESVEIPILEDVKPSFDVEDTLPVQDKIPIATIYDTKEPSPSARRKGLDSNIATPDIVTINGAGAVADGVDKERKSARNAGQGQHKKIDLDDLPDSVVDDSGYQDHSVPSSVDLSPERNVVPTSSFLTPVTKSEQLMSYGTPAASFFTPVSHFSAEEIVPSRNEPSLVTDTSPESFVSSAVIINGGAVSFQVVDLTQNDDDFIDMPVVGLSPRPSDGSFQFGAPDTAITDEQSFSEESSVEVPLRDSKAIIRVHESHRRTLEGIQGLSNFEPTDTPEIFRLAAKVVPEKKLIAPHEVSFLDTSAVSELHRTNTSEVESPESTTSNGRPELSSRIIEGGESPQKPSVKLPQSVKEELESKTKEELIILVHSLRQVMKHKDEYISAILLRCMEQCPTVLESPLINK